MLPRVFLPLVFLSFSFPAFSQTLSGTRGNFRIVSDSGKVLINDLHADTVFLCFNKTFVFTLKSGKVGLRTFPEGKICDEVYDRITLGIVQDDFNDEPFFEGGVVRVFYSPDSTLLLKDISVPGGQRSLKFWPLNDSLYPVDDLLKYRTGVTVIADKNIVIKNDGGMTYDERSMTPEDPSFFISANAPVALAHASVLFHLDDLSHPIDSAYSFYYVKPYFFREDNYRFNGDLWFEHLISKDAVFRRSDSLAKSGMDSIQLAVLAAENHFAYSRSKDSVSSSGISFWSNNGSKGVFECSGDYPYLFITGYRDKALTWGGTDMSCSYTPASGRWVLNYHDPSDAVENMRKLVVGNKMSGFDFLSQQEENEFFWLYFQNGDRVSYDYLRNVFSPYAYGKKLLRIFFPVTVPAAASR